MNYVFYDLETTGKNRDWSQIIQFGAILVNENLHELERYEAKCSLKPGIVPEPEALLVNKHSIKDLSKQNFSHYDLLKEIKSKFNDWSPAVFFGFNSIQFDEEILRKSFFKTLLDVYITQLEGNKRGDILNIARSSFFYNKNSFKVILNSKGNPSFKLEDLSKANNIKHHAHDAMGDVEASIKLANIIKTNSPDLWKQSLRNCHKIDVEKFLHKHSKFSYLDFNFGKTYSYILAFLFFHPKFKYPQCYNLLIDPNDLLKLNFSDLKYRMSQKPSIIKSIAHSKHPSIFEYQKSLKLKKLEKHVIGGIEIDYKLDHTIDIDEKELNHRVDIINKNEDFKEKIRLILNEQYEEKEDFKSQVDILAEESLYQGGFPSFKDKQLMNKFHQCSWQDKFKLSTQFEDYRFVYFAQRIIYEESPETLPKKHFNKIHKSIANQILTLDDVNWFTIPKAFKQIDDLREKYNNENNEEKIRFLTEINEFLEKIQSIYEPAKYL